ncbi:hypothetical protein ACFPIF_02395 [Brevundimonas faecalis]|uniref:hypothetical protein n=1 Tax=Brevundimonas faecalis TaxID=947378 RepID=UPI0036201B94
MSKFISGAAGTIAVAAALLASSASAESFTMPPPASGTSYGNISIDLQGAPPVSCPVEVWWNVADGVVNIDGMVGTGSADCENSLWISRALVFTAANSTTPGHANIVIFYQGGLSLCHGVGAFNNSTQTFAFSDNGSACKISGSLHLPGVTLAP